VTAGLIAAALAFLVITVPITFSLLREHEAMCRPS